MGLALGGSYSPRRISSLKPWEIGADWQREEPQELETKLPDDPEGWPAA